MSGTGDVPADAKPLEEWLDELGLKELTARLADRRLIPFDYVGASHPRGYGGEIYTDLQAQLHVASADEVEEIARLGWLTPDRWERRKVFAAPSPKGPGGHPQDYDRKAVDKELRCYVREHGWPKTQSVLVNHILDLGKWGEPTWAKERVSAFWHKHKRKHVKSGR